MALPVTIYGQYQTGTVSVTKNSAVVTGTGTIWNGTQTGATVVNAGDIFTVDDSRLYFIQSVDSATQITLNKPYQGETAEGLEYRIVLLAAAHFPADTATKVARTIERYERGFITLEECQNILQNCIDIQNAVTSSEAAAAQSAQAAASSASAAAESQTAAAASAAAALASQNAAQTAQSNAAASASAAAGSAQNAAQSAQAAATSAFNAANVVTAGNAINITNGEGGTRVIGVMPSALHTVYSGTATDSEIAAMIQSGDLYIREG